MMRVVFYHVGKGDLSLVLLPSGDAIMIDCYKADEIAADAMTQDDSVFERVRETIREHRARASAGSRDLLEAVRAEENGTKKIPVALLAITHADRDHITVRKRLREAFDIEMLADSGREYDSSTDCMKDYLAYRKAMQDAGRYWACRRATFNVFPSTGAKIDILSPNRDIDRGEDNNKQCMVIRIEHNGYSFLFTGDSPLDDWIAADTGILSAHPGRARSFILNASHHGSRTFFTPCGQRPPDQPPYEKKDFDRRAIREIAPWHTFITCSDDEESEFPHPIALDVYNEETNPGLNGGHVILSRDSKHMHYVVTDDRRLYSRTSHSRTNQSSRPGQPSRYLRGYVKGGRGYLDGRGIWVVREPLTSLPTITCRVEAKGPWTGEIEFDWWVLNNGQDADVRHREFYTIDSRDRKKQSRWSRTLAYAGVHLMQCHASTEDGTWANWCVPICHESCVHHASEWLSHYAGCIDPGFIHPG